MTLCMNFYISDKSSYWHITHSFIQRYHIALLLVLLYYAPGHLYYTVSQNEPTSPTDPRLAGKMLIIIGTHKRHIKKNFRPWPPMYIQSSINLYCFLLDFVAATEIMRRMTRFLDGHLVHSFKYEKSGIGYNNKFRWHKDWLIGVYDTRIENYRMWRDLVQNKAPGKIASSV